MEKGALIGQGRTAEVYAWGVDRVLKLYQARIPGYLVEQEYNVTRAAQAASLPVPVTENIIEVEGRYGIVFERLEGPSMLVTLSAQPWRLIAMARRLGELHAQIHNCQVQTKLPFQRQQIENDIATAKDLSEDLRQAARSCLAQLPDGISLCHGDFHPDNILMTSRGPVIIDWMNGTRGNPLADVCRTSLLFQTTGLPPGSSLHLRLLLNTSRTLIEIIYRDRYLQIHPASRQQIGAWLLPLMAARLREVENYPKEKQILMDRIQAAIPGSN